MIVHTPTLEDFNEVTEYSYNIGKEWAVTTRDRISNIWLRYGEDTCINMKSKTLLYCHYAYYIDVGKVVISMNEFYILTHATRINMSLKDFI